MNSAKGSFQRATRKLVPLLAAALGVTPISSAFGQSAWYVAPEVSFFYPDQTSYDGNDISLGISAGYQTADWYRFELGYYALELVPKNLPGLVKQKNLQLVGYWDWARLQRAAVYGSFGLGAARTYFNEDIQTLPYAIAGLGLSFRLLQSGRLTLGSEIRARYSYDKDQALGQRETIDGQYLLSLVYTFWQNDSHPPDSSPTNIEGEAQSGTKNSNEPHDRDRDEVPDSRDRCPNTIPNVKVDADGCMIGG